MIPDLGKVAVKKLLILSNYTKVYYRFPPLDATMSRIKRDLIASGGWEEPIQMPVTPVQSPGGSLT